MKNIRLNAIFMFLPISGFRQTWKNLENLENGLILKKVRETQGNSGKSFDILAKSGKTQGKFLGNTVQKFKSV